MQVINLLKNNNTKTLSIDLKVIHPKTIFTKIQMKQMVAPEYLTTALSSLLRVNTV